MAPSSENASPFTAGSECETFYNANIHESRLLPLLCRGFPLGFVSTVTVLSIIGAYKHQLMLLWLAAIFNVSLWLWVVSTGLIAIHAAVFKLNGLEQSPSPSAEPNAAVEAGCQHLVVFPNYQEDEALLSDTLQSLSEAEGAQSFWVVLGMEAREGDAGQQKATDLKKKFADHFKRIIISNHPSGLMEVHQDGTEDPEVPGKASNLKYAVEQAYKECTEVGLPHDNVVLTVADADCMFHPYYFSQVCKDFQHRRVEGTHQHTVWQAPQFPYRNFFTAPIVSRVWGYVASTYEFGGVCSTAWGGHQMFFSSYSMPLSLAHQAQPWDGDVIAEDHHCWLKSFYFSLYQLAYQKSGTKQSIKAQKKDGGDVELPLVQTRPIFLPVKSTMVETKEYSNAWIERWSQAKRHAQGVGELPYALYATYEAFRSCILPKRMGSWAIFVRMGQAVLRLFCMHILPIVQAIVLAVLSIKWFLNDRQIPLCPNKLWFFGDVNHFWHDERYALCGLAGAWVLVWPMVVPWALIVISNFLVVRKVFLQPAAAGRFSTLWHRQDGKPPPNKNAALRAWGMICFDAIFGMSWILIPYGFVVQILAHINILFLGNRGFSYVSASKGEVSLVRVSKADYGATQVTD